uniref:Oxidoreductase molybdopterin-binding domain-containing protein n=1 Tax=candidate division WOR-3 bacterium TaxID=2052148 RepID=A0A7V3KNJ3_UNCW3
MAKKVMRRREFIKIIGLTTSGLFPSCIDAKEGKRLLKNETKPGFYIRFYKPFEPVNVDRWRLEVSGLCEKPLKLSLSDIMRFPQVTQVSRLKCVECWSSKASWTGFRPQVLFDLVKPLKKARHLYFYSADDYFEYISLEDLLKPRVLFVHTMNGRPLPDEHGAPLRLIIPFKYGYKNVKTITRLVFVEKGGDGYWSQYGYSANGTIQLGADYLLDTGEKREIKKQGEPDY